MARTKTTPAVSSPYPYEPTNADRADWALTAVKVFAEETGMGPDRGNEELFTVLQDLLCDIMHLCDVEGVSFEEVFGQARGVYNEEVQEEAAGLDG